MSPKRFIIRTIRLAHCKRGPELCPQCREMNEERICLLDIEPPDAGLMQRRVTKVEIDGEKTWREYDIVQTFPNPEEARRYAEDHGIDDVKIQP